MTRVERAALKAARVPLWWYRSMNVVARAEWLAWATQQFNDGGAK